MNGPALHDDPDDMLRAWVEPGAHLHAASTMARPNALLCALARTREGRRDVTVSVAAVHSSAHALALSAAVRHVITGFLGDVYPMPRHNPLYARVAEGHPFTAEIWPLWTLVQRLAAAGAGAPAAVTRSLLTSDLRHALTADLRTVTTFEGGAAHLVRPLAPDLTLMHAVLADRRGNLVLGSPSGEGAWAAYAARHGVLASTERVVERLPDGCSGLLVVPGHLVRALCPAPRGAHPQALATPPATGVAGYADDYAFLEDVNAHCRRGAGAEWFDQWVRSPRGHADYLRRLDSRPRLAARPSSTAPSTPSARERLVILGARAVRDHVLADGYRTVLAGIGHSHLAAWLARDLLARRGVDIRVCAELGFCDMRPADGQVHLFAPAHVPGASHRVGLPEVLGGIVTAGGEQCLGVLSTAQIDRSGTLNTCLLPDGRWLTGPGGACDIAAAADCVVLAQAEPRRYVASVWHCTSPGDRVRTCVSHYGRFERASSGEPLALATWLPPQDAPGQDPAGMVDRTTQGWSAGDRPPVLEPAVTARELDALRALDPDGVYR
ncbi:CoA-transferase [[Kitasatospora] papulosa]|uniref:CoA-transferase n=2 Tax=Streptomyces TaxID=1883 RepID=UPI0036B777F9